jgi:hypothetical protein
MFGTPALQLAFVGPIQGESVPAGEEHESDADVVDAERVFHVESFASFVSRAPIYVTRVQPEGNGEQMNAEAIRCVVSSRGAKGTPQGQEMTF